MPCHRCTCHPLFILLYHSSCLICFVTPYNWRRPFSGRNVLLSEAIYHVSYARKPRNKYCYLTCSCPLISQGLILWYSQISRHSQRMCDYTCTSWYKRDEWSQTLTTYTAATVSVVCSTKQRPNTTWTGRKPVPNQNGNWKKRPAWKTNWNNKGDSLQ